MATLIRQQSLGFGVLCGCEGPVTSADWGTGAVDDADVQSNAVNRTTTVAKGFEREAKRIACLMRDRYNLGLVDVGGCAVRAYQGAATGYLASRFDELGRGLAVFAPEMDGAGCTNTVLVISKFGRTSRQSCNRGTNRGHGTVAGVMRGVRGQRIGGAQVRVEQASLFQNRDFSVLNGYRIVLRGVFRRQFGSSPEKLDHVFPGAKLQDLKIL